LNDKPAESSNTAAANDQGMVKIVSARNETKEVNSERMQTIYKDGKTIIDPAELLKVVVKVKEEEFEVKEEEMDEMSSIVCEKFENHQNQHHNLKIENAQSQFNLKSLRPAFKFEPHNLKNAATFKAPPQKFPCSLCTLTFAHESSLLIHQVQHKTQKPTFEYTCDLCSSVFGDKFTLEVHMNVLHRQTRRFTCRECGFEARHIHVMRHHKRRCKVCKSCKKAFLTRELLDEHVKKTHNRAGIACEVCGKKFKTRTYVNRYFKISHCEL
jgi:hypothetical protein